MCNSGAFEDALAAAETAIKRCRQRANRLRFERFVIERCDTFQQVARQIRNAAVVRMLTGGHVNAAMFDLKSNRRMFNEKLHR